jgi:serine/threonine-protein kinase
MEYLEGEDLAGWLRRRGRLPFAQATDFVLQACEAIAEAHALGIVHRDLKPANLFVTRRRDGALSVKVLDFGISKMLGSGPHKAVSITKTSITLGSPLYMSPEQLQSTRDVDVRTDIWGLGVILYELVAGTSPFASDSMPEFVAKVLSTTPAPLASIRPETPAGFDAVVRRCLERDRARRYASIAHLAADLLRFAPPHSRISLQRISGVLGGANVAATLLDTPHAPARGDLTTGARAVSSGVRPAKRGGGLLLLACALLLAGGAAAFFFVRLRPAAGGQPERVTAAPALPPPPAAVTIVETVTPGTERPTPSATLAPSPASPPSSPPAPPPSAVSRPVSATPRPKKPPSTAELEVRKASEASPPAPGLRTSSPSSVPPRNTSDAFDDRK